VPVEEDTQEQEVQQTLVLIPLQDNFFRPIGDDNLALPVESTKQALTYAEELSSIDFSVAFEFDNDKF